MPKRFSLTVSFSSSLVPKSVYFPQIPLNCVSFFVWFFSDFRTVSSRIRTGIPFQVPVRNMCPDPSFLPFSADPGSGLAIVQKIGSFPCFSNSNFSFLKREQ
jgi:hypothetical protein